MIIISSGISIDKDITKKTLKGIGVKTLPCKTVKNEKEIYLIKNKLKYPVIIKPATLGSSIGIETAKNSQELLESSRSAFRYDNKIIIEPKLENIIEINCSAYQDECGNVYVSECEKPISKDEILSFNDKYNNGEREFPANIDCFYSDKIKEITRKIYKELDFTGIIRIDFFIKDKEVYVNEINSVPGSLAYYLFTPSLKEFSKILTTIIMKAIKDYSKNCTLKREYKTSILCIEGSKGSKKL